MSDRNSYQDASVRVSGLAQHSDIAMSCIDVLWKCHMMYICFERQMQPLYPGGRAAGQVPS